VLTACVAAPGGGAAKIAGLREAMIAFELAIMLFDARFGFTGGTTKNPGWSFLDPLRPALFTLPPLMVVATKAATAKHATIIFMGVERVMLMVGKGKFKLVCERYEKVGVGLMKILGHIRQTIIVFTYKWIGIK
jgi:hypothetical protein